MPLLVFEAGAVVLCVCCVGKGVVSVVGRLATKSNQERKQTPPTTVAPPYRIISSSMASAPICSMVAMLRGRFTPNPNPSSSSSSSSNLSLSSIELEEEEEEGEGKEPWRVRKSARSCSAGEGWG